MSPITLTAAEAIAEQEARFAKADARIQARREFEVARMIARDAIEKVLKLDLPEHFKAQGRAIAGLAGLKLHRITEPVVGGDFLSVRDDLEAIARNVDPLIEEIGKHAAENSHDIECELFVNQLRGALEGNATYELEKAAKEMAAADDDFRIDRRSYAKARAFDVS